MNIILSTRNPSKAEQIKAIFGDSNITLLTLDDVGIEGDAVEDGETLEENATKKAVYAQGYVGNAWTMADDTGLFITALSGRPGIKASRWAGDTATTEEITAHTLKSLQGVTDRSAVFRTAVVLMSPQGEKYIFVGEVNGVLLDKPRTKPQPKMPYSGIFVPEGSDKVWAEMSVEEENAISHRGKAFRKAKLFLRAMKIVRKL